MKRLKPRHQRSIGGGHVRILGNLSTSRLQVSHCSSKSVHKTVYDRSEEVTRVLILRFANTLANDEKSAQESSVHTIA